MNSPLRLFSFALTLTFALLSASSPRATERHENFDTDPKDRWEGVNNRPAGPPREVRQDFGYDSKPDRDGLGPPRIGGLVSPAAEPAWCALPIPPLTLDDKITASGGMQVMPGAGNTLIGFFNSATAKEWRTANSLAWRINGRGETFHAHFEYATRLWRAGAGIIGRHDQVADRMHPVEMPAGRVMIWSLEYDPAGNNGGGTMKAMLDGRESVADLSPGHKAEGATFDRFGMLNVMKSADGPGEIWIGALTINGKGWTPTGPGDVAPPWKDASLENHNNRRAYTTYAVRPWFDIGWSATAHAGGGAGEIGGRFFRGDCREAARLAYYGDRLTTLTLEKPFRASGRVTLRRGVSDSTTLFGFFHHERSIRVHDSQASATPEDFAGIAVEGPSSEGFYVYPVARGHGGDAAIGFTRAAPRILPDGSSHEWHLDYAPSSSAEGGTLKVTMDGVSAQARILPELRVSGAAFDRFGFVTPWIDGNEQTIYFDDLTYTISQE